MLNALDKSARNQGNVKYVKNVKCFGPKRAQKGQTFDIFNISLVLGEFWRKKTFNISPVS